MTDSERHLALRIMMMPRDTNPYGTIFGGVLLSHIDQAGAVGARHAMASQQLPAQPIVTVAMDRVEFHEPVFVGDVVSFWTTLKALGRTSITMHVEVEAERAGESAKVTEAEVTYVAVTMEGNSRRPTPIRGK